MNEETFIRLCQEYKQRIIRGYQPDAADLGTLSALYRHYCEGNYTTRSTEGRMIHWVSNRHIERRIQQDNMQAAYNTQAAYNAQAQQALRNNNDYFREYGCQTTPQPRFDDAVLNWAREFANGAAVAKPVKKSAPKIKRNLPDWF